MSLRFPLESKNVMDSQPHPLPHGLSLSNLLCSVRFLCGIPFFNPAGMLVDFDRGTVQHQRCFVHQILLNQGCKDIFPYSRFCPCAKPAICTLPWLEALRQIPPWYSHVQPIQDPVEHYPVAFSWLASLRLLFWRKLIPYLIPLLFAYFMSFHVLHFTIKVKISSSNVLADHAYGAKTVRAYISEQGASYVIPPQSNVSDPWPVDWWLYKERHLVECFFQKLKWFRRTATRYDKLDASFLAFVYIAAIAILLI